MAVVVGDAAWARARNRAVVNSCRAPRVGGRPLVSVVISTYNWSSVLRWAIASVVGQRYRNWELLVVGDGCTDDTADVVDAFADARIRWLPLAVNSGSQSAPNNHGIAHARGEYIAYLGHDDLWLPNHLSWTVSALQRSGAAIAASGCLALGPDGSNVLRLTCLGLDPRAGHWLPPTSVVHRRDAVEHVGAWRDFRELDRPPDVDFVERFRECGLRGVRVPAVTAVKFNSAWRPGSYVTRSDAEQRACLERIRHYRWFVARQLRRLEQLRVADAPESLPETPAPPPGEIPLGWQVMHWRRLRGLPDLPSRHAESQPTRSSR